MITILANMGTAIAALKFVLVGGFALLLAAVTLAGGRRG